MIETLTRTDQVLAVLQAGGRAQQHTHGKDAGLWVLYDADGRQLAAWSNAIRAAHRIHANNPRTQQRTQR